MDLGLAGRSCAVTGAGRGIGRATARMLCEAGAQVLLVARTEDDVRDAAAECGRAGAAVHGRAAHLALDITEPDAAERILADATDRFGGLDVVVNNAGFVRDRMFVSCSEEEWDAVVRVHLKGHFCVARHAAAWWRDQAKATGAPVDARIVNTSSGAGILGSVGQSAYSSAKAGIATLTLVQATELARYGITANAICPAARTRMTEGVFTDMMAEVVEGQFDAMAPENVSPLVVWLGSSQSAAVTGHVFEVEGGKIGIAEGYHHGPSEDIGRQWHPSEVGPAVANLLAEATPAAPVYGT